MPLDATSREANLRDSIKKYFVDNIHNTEGIPVTFDIMLSTPDISGIKHNRWVTVNFGPIELSSLADLTLNVFCLTRQDAEGFRLAQTRDKVMGYLTDNTKTDGMARMPLYRSSRTEAWELLDGGLIITEVIEGPQLLLDDQTKYKQLTCRVRWSCKF